MIYSDRKRFVFLHNPKTAGVSLRTILQPLDDSGGVFWDHEFRPELERIVDKAHLSLSELRVYPEAASRLATHFVFGFVRNPYDRTLSAYRHHCRAHQRPTDDFEEFLGRLTPAAIRFDWRLVHFSPQHRFFYEGDKCRADFIGRHERLAVDFRYLARRLGLEGELGRENASDDVPPTDSMAYLDQYTPRAVLLVNDLYAEDFLLFGYDMLTPAGLDVARRADESSYSREVHDRWLPAHDLFAGHYARVTAQLQAAHEELQATRAQAGRLEAAAAEERRRADLLGVELAETRQREAARLEELEARLHALEREHTALRDEERRLRAVVEAGEAVAAELAYMKHSRSWRLTAPLRHLRAGGR